MKFRNTEKNNKRIINHAIKRKISPKKIVKKNTQRTSKKKNVKKSLINVATSFVWSMFCPKNKQTQNKTTNSIENNYELKSKKLKIKNKPTQILKSVLDPIKNNDELKSKKEKIKNKPTQILKSSLDPIKNDYELKSKKKIKSKPTQILKSVLDPRKEKKEEIKFNRNETTKNVAITDVLKRPTSNVKKTQKVMRSYARSLKSVLDPKKNEKKKFVLKLNRNGTTKKGVIADVFKRRTSNMKNPRKVMRSYARPYYRDNDRKRHQYKSPEREMRERTKSITK